MKDNIFIGFSTRRPGKSRSWAVFDLDLIKEDLTNAFMTRIGERVMRPDYGCSIWDYVGEQLTPDVVEAVETEAQRIVELDLRVQLKNIAVTSLNNTLVVNIELYYTKLDIVDTFRITFENRQ